MILQKMIVNLLTCVDLADTKMTDPIPNNPYPVYPEDDGYDKPINPYSPV